MIFERFSRLASILALGAIQIKKYDATFALALRKETTDPVRSHSCRQILYCRVCQRPRYARTFSRRLVNFGIAASTGEYRDYPRAPITARHRSPRVRLLGHAAVSKANSGEPIL